MFKVVKERLVWWPVVWDVPVDGGKVEQTQFKLKFRMVDLTQLNALVTQIEQLERDDAALVDQWLNIVQKISVDWEGVAHEDGSTMAFTPDNVRLLLSVPGTFNAIFSSYRGFIAGIPEERAKN